MSLVDVPAFSKVNKMCQKYASQYQDRCIGQAKVSVVHSLVTNMKEAKTQIIYTCIKYIMQRATNGLASCPSGWYFEL